MNYEECTFYIIENSQESKNEFHKIAWGGEEIEVNQEHLDALLNGKALAWSDGEYTHIITLNIHE